VEITCHGELVCPSSTLHGLVNLWHRKEPVPASLGAPAKEFVMVLGYRRRHRPLTPASSPRAPPDETTNPGR
jgi:E3 ubiquitin-protein ligase DRIP